MPQDDPRAAEPGNRPRASCGICRNRPGPPGRPQQALDAPGRPVERLLGAGVAQLTSALHTERLRAKAEVKKLEGEIMKLVDEQLGAVARPARVRFVSVLPKTRSGKLLRRAIQAVCEQRDPGDLTTMDDPAALQQIKDLVSGA